MLKKYLLPSLLILITITLAILSFIILPDQVITQFGFGGSDSNTVVSKPLAIIIPTLIGLGGSIPLLFKKENEELNIKSIILPLVGILVFILMLIVNR